MKTKVQVKISERFLFTLEKKTLDLARKSFIFAAEVKVFLIAVKILGIATTVFFLKVKIEKVAVKIYAAEIFTGTFNFLIQTGKTQHRRFKGRAKAEKVPSPAPLQSPLSSLPTTCPQIPRKKEQRKTSQFQQAFTERPPSAIV